MNRRFSPRAVAAVAGGFAIGVLGSRLLTPALAAGNGNIRSRLGEDPFERLIQDHREIIATLQRMEETPASSTLTRAKLFQKLKRTLAKHSMAEEDIVYPMLNDATNDASEAKPFYEDHADIKVRLFELERLLKTGEEWTGQVRDLREIIEIHAQEEEQTEFPKLREALDERRTRMLSSQIRREEALVL